MLEQCRPALRIRISLSKIKHIGACELQPVQESEQIEEKGIAPETGEKLNAVADIETVQSQLVKTQPSKSRQQAAIDFWRIIRGRMSFPSKHAEVKQRIGSRL